MLSLILAVGGSSCQGCSDSLISGGGRTTIDEASRDSSSRTAKAAASLSREAAKSTITQIIRDRGWRLTIGWSEAIEADMQTTVPIVVPAPMNANRKLSEISKYRLFRVFVCC